jgi:rSAM/selenodomain-associated transferase 1
MGRLPRHGPVKTRLGLAPAEASKLYEAFLRDVFDMVGAVPVPRRVFSWVFTEFEWEEAAARDLAPPGWRIARQSGESLGERIESARAAAEARQVVVIGSDAPAMAPSRLVEAFEALDAGAGAVFGPTEDGGYDLIGLPGPRPELLAGIPWSTRWVMAETRRAAARAGIALHELSTGHDVDTFADLARALADAERPGSFARRTAKAIREVLDAVDGPAGLL